MSFRGTQFPQGDLSNYGADYSGADAQSAPSYDQPKHHYGGTTPAGVAASPLDKINELIPSDNQYVQQFEQVGDQVEGLVDQYLGAAKPYVPSIGRFFIVATFLEDSLRIMSQWKDQVYYLSTYRHLYEWVVKLFLSGNVIAMIVGSVLVILRKKPELATAILSTIVLLQGLVYGLMFEMNFFLRNVSVIGGLLLALSDSMVIDKRKMSLPGLPMLESQDHKKYFLLAGRMMLIVLFLAFMINAGFSFFSLLTVLIGIFSCTAVAIGYRTKFNAAILTAILSIFNVLTNHYWTYEWKDARRDYERYEFFQILSIIGGLLLIVNTGAGELSIDEKKKKY